MKNKTMFKVRNIFFINTMVNCAFCKCGTGGCSSAWLYTDSVDIGTEAPFRTRTSGGSSCGTCVYMSDHTYHT